MEKIEKAIYKFNEIIEFIFGIVGILLILIATYGVFSRSILEVSAAWTDETMKVMIAMTLVEDSLSNKRTILGVVKIIQFVAALVIAVALAIQSWQIVATQITSGAKTAIVGYPLWFTNTGFLLGNVITIIFLYTNL